MNLLKEDLERYGCRPVWFNAWHHRAEEHLLAALFESIRLQAVPPWWSSIGVAFRLQLLWLRGRRLLANLLGAALLVLIAGAVIWVSGVPTEPIRAFIEGQKLRRPVDPVEWLTGLGLAGVALAVLISLLRRMEAFPESAAKLLASLSSRARLRDFRDQLAFRHHFAEALGEVCQALRTQRSPGLVVLIDDLDRCQPEDVVKILEAVNFCTSAGPCIIVMGMDRRQVEHTIGLGFEKVIEGMPDDELLLLAGEQPDKAGGKRRAFARHYLEKLINIEVPVPSLADDDLGRLLDPPERGGHAEEAPRWLGGVKRAVRGTVQFLRVGVLAAVVGLGAVWLLDRHPPGQGDPPPLPREAQEAAVQEMEVVPAPPTAAPTGPEVEVFAPARIDLPIAAITGEELARSRHWLWWLPAMVVLLLAVLWGVGMVSWRAPQTVQDTAAFRTALRCVEPLLAAAGPTPRTVKRYQNRMRYLAERLRRQAPDTDWIDGLLYRLGRLTGRQRMPESWFAPLEAPRINEPALILLGAIEAAAPWAFRGKDDDVLGALDNAANLQDGDGREGAARLPHDAWQATQQRFHAARNTNADFPDPRPGPEAVRLYRQFVLGAGH